MDSSYEPFCLNHPLFYELPTKAGGRGREFGAAQRPVPAGWERFEQDDWLVHAPRGCTLPRQGWKIHASACLDNAEAILDCVFDYCVSNRIAFKFIRHEQLLLLRNAKSADRFASGKFITIYPADDAQLCCVLTGLGALLEGQAGPYILSDLRWGNGPLHVRYGGFVLQTRRTAAGDVEPVIQDPDGNAIPDVRGPYSMPSWVELPDCLRPHLDARSATTIADLPYDVERALHFSNGGGVYVGTDRKTGAQVVIKEARPHAGLSATREDAVTRLRRERDILAQLDGLSAAPALRGHFVAGEHHFLVQDFVEGATLTTLFAEKFPLIAYGCDDRTIAEYTHWAVEMCGKVERAAATVHARGVVIQDLNPSNVMVGPDGRVTFVDWEIAAQASEQRRASLGASGFTAPPDRTGIDVDAYALACLRLHLFLPLTTLLRFDAGKAGQLADAICARFPVPREFIAQAVDIIVGADAPDAAASAQAAEFVPDPEAWHAARAAMARAILASATPGRNDRLFPGDIAQFAPGGGINLAFGAAGVLYALEAAGVGRCEEHEDWLIRRALDSKSDAPLGFYDGLHGVAYALDRLGRRQDALAVLDIAVDRLGRDWAEQPLDLFGGLAGIGLNLAQFAQAEKDSTLAGLAMQCADAVAERLRQPEALARAGLVHGASGVALLLLRLYEQTGDARLLDYAESALDRDLSRCLIRDDGTLQVDEGWRTMPYLGTGSVGIGMVLDLMLAHRRVERFEQPAVAIRKAAEAQFFIQPGLSQGLAGIILYLCNRSAARPAAEDPAVAAHLRNLSWYALQYEGGLAFPGEQLLRLSMDLFTGTAGVMLAAGAALNRHPVHLPFLGPAVPGCDGGGSLEVSN